MENFKVTIDGKPNVLRYVCKAHGGYQYNTIGNKSAHNFNTPLDFWPKNEPVITGGCEIIVIEEVKK